MMPADPVIEALAEQVACYKRLAKLAATQHEHVRQSRTEELLDVLKKRQEVLEQITALERVVGPAKRQWTEYLLTLPDADRSVAEAHMEETRLLLLQITSADRDDALVLQQRKLSLGKQINKASVARQINRSYATAAYGKPQPRMDVQQ